jgi:hypothetical protein
MQDYIDLAVILKTMLEWQENITSNVGTSQLCEQKLMRKDELYLKSFFYNEGIFVSCFIDLDWSHLSIEAMTLLRALGGHNFCNATNFTSH